MMNSNQSNSKHIMDAIGIDLALARIAAEILERLNPPDDIAIIGIRRRGEHLACRLCGKLEAILKRPVPNGVLDITLYRDDLTTVSDQPVLRPPAFNFDIQARSIILVDDVLYTGRTVRTALDGLLGQGRPRRVQLAVLIDRGHRELPIHPDYTGRYLDTADDEIVKVHLVEEEGEDKVIVVRK